MAAMLIHSAGLCGDTYAQSTTSLKALLEEAKIANPEILAAREAASAAGHRSTVAKGYPDPSLSYSYFVENVETRLGPQQHILQFIQPVPFPGKLSLKGRISEYDARIMKEQSIATEYEVLRDVKEAFFSIAALEKDLAVLSEQKEVLDRFEKIVRTRLETGRVSQHDLLKIQIERLKLDERKLNYNRRRTSHVAALNAKINRAPDVPILIGPIESISKLGHSIEELKEAALNRPDLRAGETRIEQRRLSLTLARRKYLPDFMVGMSYIGIGKSPMDVERSGEDAWNISIGARIPLWFGKVRGEVREAKGMIRYLEKSLEAIKVKTLADVEDLYNQYRTALDLVRLYELDLIPRAEQSLRSAEAGYIAGDVDFLYMLDSERILLELRIALSDRKAEVEKRIADIEAVVGMELVNRK